MKKWQLLLGLVSFIVTFLVIFAGSKEKGLRASELDAPEGKLVVGYFVNWDNQSFESLQKNIDELSVLMPEWLALQNETGELKVLNEDKISGYLKFVRSARPSLKIVPLINNYDGARGLWDGDILQEVLTNNLSRKKLERELVSYVTRNNFQGVSIDFENIPREAQPSYLIFLEELYKDLSPLNIKLYVNVPLDNADYNYQQIQNTVDYVILMAYDEHASESLPGPVASIDWFTNGIDKRLNELKASKVVVALGNYGYDWVENEQPGKSVIFKQAKTIADNAGVEIDVDPESLNSYFTYTDTNNKQHEIWLLDAASMESEIKTLASYNLAGYALWRLGSEDPDVWSKF